MQWVVSVARFHCLLIKLSECCESAAFERGSNPCIHKLRHVFHDSPEFIPIQISEINHHGNHQPSGRQGPDDTVVRTDQKQIVRFIIEIKEAFAHFDLPYPGRMAADAQAESGVDMSSEQGQKNPDHEQSHHGGAYDGIQQVGKGFLEQGETAENIQFLQGDFGMTV